MSVSNAYLFSPVSKHDVSHSYNVLKTLYLEITRCSVRLNSNTMETLVTINSDLHFEHVQWKSELAFWNDELKTFNHRLEELVVRWTAKDVLKELEHYQNQFIIHSDVLDDLNHEINVHETAMSEADLRNDATVHSNDLSTHLEFRRKMETERTMYAELKKNFYRFLSKYM